MAAIRRVIAVCFLLAGAFAGCTPADDATRTTQHAGGTIPWNRPESWEGAGALGGQINQFSQ